MENALDRIHNLREDNYKQRSASSWDIFFKEDARLMEDNTEYVVTQRRCSLAMVCGRTSLFILMAGYALLGALIFKALEGGSDNDFAGDFHKSREDCLKELWIITERLNVLYEKNWTRLVTEQLKRFERSVVESARHDGDSNISGPKWTFGGSLLYSLTLLTTVGYGRLSPRTTLGKITAIVYAIIGVPLMLILLSALGSLLANGARRGYTTLCCKKDNKSAGKCPSVGYHKAPTSPAGSRYSRSCKEDTASIQIASTHSTPNHVSFKANNYVDHHEVPKRAILATVRSSRTRGKCRQGPVKQMLADHQFPVCPAHNHRHNSPLKNSSIVGISTDLELDDTDDTDDGDQGVCTHDTPSRVPLIWRPPDHTGPPLQHHPTTTVPVVIVIFFFVCYLCAGAATFASAAGWTFLDATYFCFLALSTIGVGEKLPESSGFHEQMQVFACCLYIFLGLVVVAMCFSLVQEEVTLRCRQIANNVGLVKD